MEIINRSKFGILISDRGQPVYIFSQSRDVVFCTHPFYIYQKLNSELILIKKVTEFCNKIIIKDSLIENEVEIEIFK